MSTAGTDETTTGAARPDRVELLIGGMTCASCANRIERKLNKMAGVSATVNYATERATVTFPAGVTEADLVWDLASRLEGRLTALGVQSWATRGPNNGASDEQRAALANDVGADLVLSLHVDGSPSARANGVAAYYYGAGESSSTIGERLADLAQRELVARTGMLDNRIHGKSWALLRLTRMPTVRVELGYLTSVADRAKLLDPRFRDTMAEGLLVAVQRLYLPTADDPPTGAMRIPANAT